MSSNLDQNVEAEIGEELTPLLEAGFSVNGSDYSAEAFGNFYVDLLREKERLRIVRDRGQYILEGDQTRLEGAGLSQAFDSKAAFFAALRRYVSDDSE